MFPWDLWSYQRHHEKEWHSTNVLALVGCPVRLDSTFSENPLNRAGHPVVLRYAQ